MIIYLTLKDAYIYIIDYKIQVIKQNVEEIPFLLIYSHKCLEKKRTEKIKF